MSGLAGFLRRNIVIVLALPIIGVGHLAWYKLQFNNDFVKPPERKLSLLGVDIEKLVEENQAKPEATAPEAQAK